MKAAGNRVITVLAGRTKELIILEKDMRESSDEVIIMLYNNNRLSLQKNF